MAGIAPKRVRTQTARVAQPGRGRGLALCSGSRLPFAGYDLESHIEPRLLVSDEPDRP